jgi:hypothetical protein
MASVAIIEGKSRKSFSAIMASHFVKDFCAAGASGMDEFLTFGVLVGQCAPNKGVPGCPTPFLDKTVLVFASGHSRRFDSTTATSGLRR